MIEAKDLTPPDYWKKHQTFTTFCKVYLSSNGIASIGGKKSVEQTKDVTQVRELVINVLPNNEGNTHCLLCVS